MSLKWQRPERPIPAKAVPGVENGMKSSWRMAPPVTCLQTMLKWKNNKAQNHDRNLSRADAFNIIKARRGSYVIFGIKEKRSH